MVRRKAWNVLIAIAIASGVLALGDTIDPTNNRAERGRSGDRFNSAPSLKWIDPSWTLFSDQLKKHQDRGITFQDLGFPPVNADGRRDRDLDFFFFPRHHDHDHDDQGHHHHVAIPEPGTFLLLGTALIYCSRLLGRHLPRV